MGSSIGNAIMDVVTLGSSYQQRKAAKEQTRAASEMAAAMEKQPVVQSSGIAAQQTQNDTRQQTEQNLNTEARRRFALNKTVNTRPSPVSSLTGTRQTL